MAKKKKVQSKKAEPVKIPEIKDSPMIPTLIQLPSYQQDFSTEPALEPIRTNWRYSPMAPSNQDIFTGRVNSIAPVEEPPKMFVSKDLMGDAYQPVSYATPLQPATDSEVAAQPPTGVSPYGQMEDVLLYPPVIPKMDNGYSTQQMPDFSFPEPNSQAGMSVQDVLDLQQALLSQIQPGSEIALNIPMVGEDMNAEGRKAAWEYNEKFVKPMMKSFYDQINSQIEKVNEANRNINYRNDIATGKSIYSNPMASKVQWGGTMGMTPGGQPTFIETPKPPPQIDYSGMPKPMPIPESNYSSAQIKAQKNPLQQNAPTQMAGITPYYATSYDYKNGKVMSEYIGGNLGLNDSTSWDDVMKGWSGNYNLNDVLRPTLQNMIDTREYLNKPHQWTITKKDGKTYQITGSWWNAHDAQLREMTDWIKSKGLAKLDASGNVMINPKNGEIKWVDWIGYKKKADGTRDDVKERSIATGAEIVHGIPENSERDKLKAILQEVWGKLYEKNEGWLKPGFRRKVTGATTESPRGDSFFKQYIPNDMAKASMAKILGLSTDASL